MRELTIFTATFNRADLLPRLFQSIDAQATPHRSIEWLVVDDGSTDNTRDVVAKFTRKRPDLVRYVQLPNGGKHRAMNRAAQVARGDWVMTVDSDDYLAPGAIEDVLAIVSQPEFPSSIGILRALKGFPEAGDMPPTFLLQRNPAQHFEWVASGRWFETADVVRREVLAKNAFPEHVGECFMAEEWLWRSLDQLCLTFFVDRVWIECIYQPGGISANSRFHRARSPRSAMDVYASVLASPTSYLLFSRASANWWRYWFHANRPSVSRAAPVIFAPLGFALAAVDKVLIKWRSSH